MRELDALNAAHLDLNDRLRSSGHFIEAEALEPVARAACLRVREGKVVVTHGPFTETKEHVAGFTRDAFERSWSAPHHS